MEGRAETEDGDHCGEGNEEANAMSSSEEKPFCDTKTTVPALWEETLESDDTEFGSEDPLRKG